MALPTLPSPPAGGATANLSRKSISPNLKSVQPHRVPKPAKSNVAHAYHHDHPTQVSGMDGRRKRAWKACQRCRIKKSKCDGELPCKRCQNDGLVCTAGVGKKTQYKQPPRGYAEFLENTQLDLIATIQKLYAMVRNSEQWQLREPKLNDCGQPVIHNIVQNLGCLRHDSNFDLPVQSVFPDDKADMAELALQLEVQQKDETEAKEKIDTESSSNSNSIDCSPSSDLDQSKFEQPNQKASMFYREAPFGSGGSASNDTIMALSPQSFTSDIEFESSRRPTVVTDLDCTHTMFRSQSPGVSSFQQACSHPTQASKPMAMTPMQLQSGGLHSTDMLSQGFPESDFGTIKPQVLSCPNPEVMMGMAFP